jgi:hypothetical protein
MSIVKEIVNHAKRIADGQEEVKPGQTLRFTEACTVNDRIWQGDMALTIAENSPPEGFKLVEKTKVQLVPGNTVGSKHCLEHTNGVEQYLPENWTEMGLVGPWLRLNEDNKVIHPVHGAVEIPAGFCVQVTYQREYDEILKEERRARD